MAEHAPRARRAALALVPALLGFLGAHPVPVLAATAAPVATGGVTLDAYGGLHPFGGLSLNLRNAPYWDGWDIAREVVVRTDASGGWTLDGWGGIHAFGAAPEVALASYWYGWDIARAMVFTSLGPDGQPDGHQGYVLDGWGGIHPWGGAPELTGFPYSPGVDRARGLVLATGSDGRVSGGWTMFSDGSLHAFGSAGSRPANTSPGPVWQQLHELGGQAYQVARWGQVSGAGAPVSADWTGYYDWGGWDVIRDVFLVATAPAGPQPMSPAALGNLRVAAAGLSGGVVLDGWGGLHPFGNFPLNTGGAPYWGGWDIARAVQVRPDASGGWILDGWGGIHAFGQAPAIATPAYWAGWDIARAFVPSSLDASGIPDGAQGYLLDGYGGIHPWGGAPALVGAPYWPGHDDARGLALHRDALGRPDGGWVLRASGEVFNFGAAPALTGSPSAPEGPAWLQLHPGGSGAYLVGSRGLVRFSGSGFMVDWTGFSDWGGWDILRDIQLVNQLAGPLQVQPLSPGAAAGFEHARSSRLIPAPIYGERHILSCEAAALQMALAARGTWIDQDSIINGIPADTRPAQVGYFGDVQRWGDPYTNFVGSIDGSEWNATGYGVYYPPVADLARRLGHQVIAGEGWNPLDLYRQVLLGNPAVVWVTVNFQPGAVRSWTAWDGRPINYILAEHAMTLVGVDLDAGLVTLNDDQFMIQRTVSMAQFEASWNLFGRMAVAVQ